MELSRTFTFQTFHQAALHQWFNDLQLDGAMHKQQTLFSYAHCIQKMSLVVRKPVFGASDQVRHKPDCAATEDGFGFRKKRDCTICVTKTKALIRCAVTAQLICGFVFTYAKSRFSHNEAQIMYMLSCKSLSHSVMCYMFQVIWRISHKQRLCYPIL